MGGCEARRAGRPTPGSPSQLSPDSAPGLRRAAHLVGFHSELRCEQIQNFSKWELSRNRSDGAIPLGRNPHSRRGNLPRRAVPRPRGSAGDPDLGGRRETNKHASQSRQSLYLHLRYKMVWKNARLLSFLGDAVTAEPHLPVTHLCVFPVFREGAPRAAGRVRAEDARPSEKRPGERPGLSYSAPLPRHVPATTPSKNLL